MCASMQDSLSTFPSIDFEAELNLEQYQAVTSPDGPALVIAGAGSGKTRTLTYRVAWLLQNGIWPSEILLLTFTNKSAAEMLNRVEDLTGVAVNKFWGGTFHSIGQRILRWQGNAVGLKNNFTILDQRDSESVLTEVIRDVDPEFSKNKNHPKPKVINEIYSFSRNTCRQVQDVITERYMWFGDISEQICHFCKCYQAHKQEHQMCDYDDLLQLWLKLLQEDETTRQYYQQRFKYILVDEFQDTNHVQSAIINLLGAHHRNLMVVGDNWQCIYTWRGAEFANMETFAQNYPERKIYKIETNYRSTPEILNYANELMAFHPPLQGYPLELQAHCKSGVKPMIIGLHDTREQARAVIRRISGLVDEGRSYSDIAILYRAHYHAMDLQLEMTRADIPFTITSGLRFFEQVHIRDITAQIRFVANPLDGAAFKRVAQLLPRVGEQTAARILAGQGK